MVEQRGRGFGEGEMKMCVPHVAGNTWTVRDTGRMQLQVFDMFAFNQVCTLHTSVARSQGPRLAASACIVATPNTCAMDFSSVLLRACMLCVSQKE